MLVLNASLPCKCSHVALLCRHDETMKLIGIRSAMVDQLLKEGKSRKPSWKDIAAAFNAIGFERNPEQCSSMWSSLVKKYEVVTYSHPALMLALSKTLLVSISNYCTLTI